MKTKMILLAAVAALALAAVASAARLDLIRGTDGADNLNGTAGADLVYARAGNDNVRTHDGNDVIWPGAGADVQFGGPGNDVLHALANDNQRDILDCGHGFDVAYVIAHDPARFHGCEQVIRLTPEQAAAQAAANDDNG